MSDELKLLLDSLHNFLKIHKIEEENIKFQPFNLSKCLNETCAICLELFDANSIVCNIPCKHTFHRSCIKTWCEHKLTCPLCKTKLPINNRKQMIEITIKMLI